MAALAGAALGALAMAAALRAQAGAVSPRTADRQDGPAAEAAQDAELAELRRQLASLRHDLRGILSPALLVSDRLLGNEDAAVRRAGEVMIRTVERVTERLSETRGPQSDTTSPQQ